MIFKQKMFWAAVVAVAYLVVKFYAPQFPISQDELLAAVIFVLSLFGLEVELRLRAQGVLKK